MIAFCALHGAAQDQEGPPSQQGQEGGGKAKKKDGRGATAAEGVRIERDVAFLAPDRKEKLDLYIPADAQEKDRFPLIIEIHGGGFFGGDKASPREQGVCNALARKGYVCASLNYALAQKERQFTAYPQNVQDCKTAVRFLRKNAALYRIDTERFGAIGGSAGGYFSLMLGFTKPKDGYDSKDLYPGVSSQIQAVVDMYGPVDFTVDPASLAHARLGKILTQLDGWEKSKVRKMSPLFYVAAGAPPVLVTHGGRDRVIPISQSEQLVAALKKTGTPHYYFPVPNGAHSYDLTSSGTDLTATVAAFFDKHLKGKKVEVPVPVPGSGAEVRGGRGEEGE